MLNLPASKVTKLHREYWKLRGLDKLNTIYNETNGKIWALWKLYKELIKKRRMSFEKVANVVETAIDKLPYMESLYEQAKEQVDKMQRTIQRLENYSHTLNDEIASAKALLDSYQLLCKRKRKEAEDLNNEISRLEVLVSRFKSNNEEYLEIENSIEEKVKGVLTDNKQILQFALASVIEAIRQNPDKYNNFIAYNISSMTITTTPTQKLLPLHNEDYKTMILEESNKLYTELIKELVNRIISSVNPLKTSLSSSSNVQRLHDSPDAYRKE